MSCAGFISKDKGAVFSVEAVWGGMLVRGLRNLVVFLVVLLARFSVKAGEPVEEPVQQNGRDQSVKERNQQLFSTNSHIHV